MSKIRDFAKSLLKEDYLDDLQAWRDEENEERANLHVGGPWSKAFYDYVYGKKTAEKPAKKSEPTKNTKPQKSKAERDYDHYKKQLYNAKYNLKYSQEHQDSYSDIRQCEEELDIVKTIIRKKANFNPSLWKLLLDDSLTD